MPWQHASLSFLLLRNLLLYYMIHCSLVESIKCDKQVSTFLFYFFSVAAKVVTFQAWKCSNWPPNTYMNISPWFNLNFFGTFKTIPLLRLLQDLLPSPLEVLQAQPHEKYRQILKLYFFLLFFLQVFFSIFQICIYNGFYLLATASAPNVVNYL